MRSPALRAGDRVDTLQGGPGTVRNVVLERGKITAVIVELDDDADRQPLWRTYPPGEIAWAQPRLV